MNRYEGARAQANKLEGKPSKSEAEKMDAVMGGMESASAPEEGDSKKAKEVRIEHHHEQGKHMVHVKNGDGSEEHTEHGSVEDAYDHAHRASGLYPQENEAGAEVEPDADDFQVEPL